MSIVHLVDIRSGQTLVTYVLMAYDPSDELLNIMETVVETSLLRDETKAEWCSYNLLREGGCDCLR